MALGKFFYFIDSDNPFRLEICLIPCYGESNASRSVILKLTDPFLDLFKALARCDLINYYSSKGLSIVNWSNGVVFFLSGRILNTICDTQMASLTDCPFSRLIFFSR
jgi:hypothetical protein